MHARVRGLVAKQRKRPPLRFHIAWQMNCANTHERTHGQIYGVRLHAILSGKIWKLKMPFICIWCNWIKWIRIKKEGNRKNKSWVRLNQNWTQKSINLGNGHDYNYNDDYNCACERACVGCVNSHIPNQNRLVYERTGTHIRCVNSEKAMWLETYMDSGMMEKLNGPAMGLTVKVSHHVHR